MASAQDLQATCEDYDSDQSEQGYEFPGRSSANAANVSTKRSHPDDLNKEKPPPQERVPTNLDLRSDSGYSSYTAATVSSTNSAQSAPSQRSPPAAAPPTARPEAPQPPPPQPQQQPPPPPSTKTRRPTQSHSEQSRPKLPSRTASQSSKPLVKQRRPTITQDPRPERTERTERERLPRRDSRVEPECTDPKCTTCGPNALPQHLVRPGIKPTQSARDIDRLSADTRSMRSDPASYYQSPPSPTQLRRPPTYRQEAAIVQPAVNPRRRPSTSRPRPMSYNGEHNYQYHNPGMPAPYPSPPQEHGPPPSTSAQWRQMPQYQMGGMAPPVVPYGAPQGYPGAYSYNHTPPPYDGPQRPGMPPRASFNSARNGAAPLITQAPSREQQYSARYGQPQSATQARFPPQLQLQEVAYESDSGSETGSSEEDDDEYYEQPDPNDPRNRRALMAPQPPKIEQAKPKSKSKKQQRPPMRHANTTQVVDERPSRRMSVSQPPAQPQSLVIDERRRKRSSRTIEEPSRRASVSRPAPPSRQIQSEYPSHRGQIVVANSSKSERRRSAQVYEQVYDHYPEDRRAAKAAKEARARAREEEEARREQEQYEAELAQQKRLNRTSKQYYQPPAAFDSDEESESEESEDDQLPPEAPAPPPPQARRRRPTDAGKGKERVLEHKTKRIESAAEEYISARRGAPGPLNDPIHNAARHSRTISMPSHSGSSGSERSRSNRTAVTNENNEIRLRVDANAPLSLQFNGDMEGRTLRMIPAENGMADLVISGGRDRESVYHNSDRGSNADDRKALVPKQPRRQAEEMTENSLRNSRRRRDSQVIREQRIERSSGQRPLRQRAHTSSYYGE